MDTTDRKLLNWLQQGLPLCPEPYQDIAKTLDLTVEDVLLRITQLKSQGIIRRMGGIFDSKKLGYHSLLCSLKVPLNQIDQAAEIINRYPGVTHNYLRNHDHNIWFTLTTPSKQRQAHILETIQAETGGQLTQFPSMRKYKIRAVFNLKEDDVND